MHGCSRPDADHPDPHRGHIPGSAQVNAAHAARSAPDLSVPAKHDLLLIVVGSNLAAEIIDRPLAQRLRDEIVGRLTGGEPPIDGRRGLQPAICTDLWYLNDRDLDHLPVIALGEPSRNAATAMLCARLPTAMVIEHHFRLHLDPEFVEEQPRAALWGRDAPASAAAIQAFVDRYLDAFLAAAGLGSSG